MLPKGCWGDDKNARTHNLTPVLMLVLSSIPFSSCPSQHQKSSALSRVGNLETKRTTTEERSYSVCS